MRFYARGSPTKKFKPPRSGCSPSRHESTVNRGKYRYVRQEADRLDSHIGMVREAINKLREYRTALISAAVTGKIDVRGEVE